MKIAAKPPPQPEKKPRSAATRPNKEKCLRDAGLIISCCCIALFIIGNSIEYGQLTAICFLTSALFGTEFTSYILIYRNLGTIDKDDQRQKCQWDIIINLICGILCTVIAPAYLAAFLSNETQFAYVVISTFVHLAGAGCLFAQGVIFLILGKKQYRKTFTKVDNKESPVMASTEPGPVAPTPAPFKIVETQIVQPELQAQPAALLVLRIVGIAILPFSFMGIFILWTFQLVDYGNPSLFCIIPIVSFGLELAIYLKLSLNDGILDYTMRKLETIVHLIVGIFCIWIPIPSATCFYMYAIRVSLNKSSQLPGQCSVMVSMLLSVPAGVIFLVIGFKCWQQFKNQPVAPVELNGVVPGTGTETEPNKMEETEIKPEQPTNTLLFNSKYCGYLRIAMITIHLCILLLLTFSTTIIFEYFDYTCTLSIVSFIYELIGFLKIRWNIGIYDEARIESETIVHISLGTVSILIAISHLINLNLPAHFSLVIKENFSLNMFVNELVLYLLQVAWGLTLAQGICYLIRGILAWRRLKARQPKADTALSTIQ